MQRARIFYRYIVQLHMNPREGFHVYMYSTSCSGFLSICIYILKTTVWEIAVWICRRRSFLGLFYCMILSAFYTGTTYETYIYKKRSLQITGVSCAGTEFRLTDCIYKTYYYTLCSYDDVGVTCIPGNIGHLFMLCETTIMSLAMQSVISNIVLLCLNIYNP